MSWTVAAEDKVDHDMRKMMTTTMMMMVTIMMLIQMPQLGYIN